MDRRICHVCNFDLDQEPWHAPSCSEAPWNTATKPEPRPAPIVEGAASFDSETGEANGDEPFAPRRKRR